MSGWKAQLERWSPALAGLFCAISLILALPDFHVWPLAFVAYIPLFVSVQHRRPWVRFMAFWIAGTVMHLGIFIWVRHTMISLSGLGDTPATLVWVAFGFYEGLLLATLGLLLGPIKRLSGGLWVVTVPSFFIVLEALFPHIFTWFYGNLLYRHTLLIQISDLTGVYGLSFVLLTTNALLATAWMNRKEGLRKWMRPVAITCALWVCVMAYGALRLSQLESIPVEEEVRVAIIQPFVTPQEKKTRGGDRAILYQKAMMQMKEINPDDADLIVWPEGSFPYAFPVEGVGEKPTGGTPLGRRYYRRLREVIRKGNTPFVMGSQRRPKEDRRVRNAAIYLDAEGMLAGFYDKRRLVPFGEYVPYGDEFPRFREMLKGISDMVPGKEAAVFEVGGVRMLPSICYEAIQPEDTRHASLVEPRPQAILNLTNDVWFGEIGAPRQHLMVQLNRAVELRLPLIRATNSGISAFINDRGEITSQTGIMESGTLQDVVSIRPIWSFYREWGNVFLWGLFAWSLRQAKSKLSKKLLCPPLTTVITSR